MAASITYRCIQTAHSSVYLAIILIITTSPISRAASIGFAPPSSTVHCICTTQSSSDFEAKTDFASNIKAILPGANTILTTPTLVPPQKLTFTLRKRIKMTDQVKSGDKVVVSDDASVKVDAETDKDRSDRQVNKESPQDNIVFPKDDENDVTPASGVAKTTMPVQNRVLIGGMPNDGYGRDANGEIVEIFQ